MVALYLVQLYIGREEAIFYRRPARRTREHRQHAAGGAW